MLSQSLSSNPETPLKSHLQSGLLPNIEIQEILLSGLGINHQENTGLNQEEQAFLQSKDIGNIYSVGSREDLYPLVKYVFDLLKKGKLNIHNNLNLTNKLLSGETSKLHYVFRWGGFCFTEGEQNEMKLLVEKGDFSIGSWQKFLDKDLKIKGRVIGDGDVFEHDLNQSQLIAKYGEYDILNIIPGSCNENCEGQILKAEDYIALQVLGLVHDAGELGNGDILYDFKQNNNPRDYEKQAGIGIINSLNLDEKLKLKVLKIYDIDFDKDHDFKLLFSYYEKISYMSGAIKTYKTIGTEQEIMNPFGLIHNVLKNQIIPMVKVAKGEGMGFPLRSMQYFLLENRLDIDNMFNLIIENNFKSGIESDDLNFEIALQTWKEYKNLFFLQNIETIN